jgi:Ran GTPase-activating protein (RanGAP) involved in mRNA processing and transport
MASLASDEKRLVRHLLLGNNICGDGLGQEVASFITSHRKSGLETWYIAGNKLTAEGVQPICEALNRDDQVTQLWLKRNPLKAAGAVHVAAMLLRNSHLVVLDLVNTGLLDDGVIAVISAIGHGRGNETLRHLYLDGNGASLPSARAIAAMLLSGSNRLVTLACGGRLGDEGAATIAKGMAGDSHLKRLCLPSSGIGAEGARELARMLTTNCTLLHLDLGLNKNTAALGEYPNRIGVAGAAALAEALAVNKTLRSLNLVHNNIFQSGVASFRFVLNGGGPTTYAPAPETNTSLVRLELLQMGIPHSELTLEEIRISLRRNYLALDEIQRAAADEAMDPGHLTSIQSVYRVNGTYKDSA